MSRRIEKVNSLIHRTLGEILQREADIPADVLVTISAVETTPNLRGAKVWLYIAPLTQHEPGQVEAVFESLTKQLYALQGSLNRALSMRPLPRIYLRLDHGAEYAKRIEEKFTHLDDGQQRPV